MRQSLSPGDGRQGSPSPYRLPLKLAVKETDDVASLLILFDAAFDQFAGMNDGAMVLTAKCVTNVAEGAIGQLPREEHGYLPGKRDVCGTSLASHVREAHIEMLGNLALNLLYGDRSPSLLLKYIPQQVFNNLAGAGSDARREIWRARFPQ